MKVKITLTIPDGRHFPRISSEQASAAFGKVFSKRGYIVIATYPGVVYEIGKELRQIFEYETRRVFVVAAYTTRRDYQEQKDLLGEVTGWTRLSERRHLPGTTYYRVVPRGLLKAPPKLLPAKRRRKAA